MELRVCHYPQVPCIVNVGSLAEAKLIFDTLADYDLFQYQNNIKPDYYNVTRLQVWDDDEQDWIDWEDEETGYNFNDYVGYGCLT